MKFLRGRGKTRGAAPKLFDECIYTPYSYGKADLEPRLSMVSNARRFSDSAMEVENHAENRHDNLIDLNTSAGDTSLDNGEDPPLNHSSSNPDEPRDAPINTPDFDTEVHIPEVFLFNYGTVVIWGMTEKQEERFLKDIAKFETEKLSKDDVQTENFNFYYTRDYQARIYNDFISLREKKSYMTKLAISHALSQSVKVGEAYAVNYWSCTLTWPADLSLRRFGRQHDRNNEGDSLTDCYERKGESFEEGD